MPIDPAMLRHLAARQGGTPPGLSRVAGQTPGTPAPSNTGGASAPGAQMGNVSAAVALVTQALGLLEQALPMLPPSTDMHMKVLQQAKDLAKGLKDVRNDPALQIQSLMQQARQKARSAPQQALARIMPAASGEAEPAMAPPGGGGEQPQAQAA